MRVDITQVFNEFICSTLDGGISAIRGGGKVRHGWPCLVARITNGGNRFTIFSQVSDMFRKIFSKHLA